MTSEQKQKLLNAAVAAALKRETGQVPSREQVEEVTLLARVLYKAVLGVHINRPEQKSLGPVPSSNHADWLRPGFYAGADPGPATRSAHPGGCERQD